MLRLNLPEYNFKIIKRNSVLKIFDEIRKKYIVLIPEEWVRQNFIRYLITEKSFPLSLTAVEMSLEINNLKKRADIVVFGKNRDVKVLIECKAPEVNITQKAFDQIARYNMKFQAEYLIVTNGLKHFCCKPNYEKNNYEFLKEIPDYRNL